MGGIKPLLLHKSEWKRIQSRANPSQEPVTPTCKVDIEAMNEQSQKWIRSWPDTVEGHVHKVSLRKKAQHAKEKAEIEAFKNRPKYDNSAEIKQAREMIFERSNYGQLLKSAIAESKTLEVREVQIKFNEQVKEKQKRLEKSQANVKNIMYVEFEKGDVNKLLLKQRNIENAQFNKAIAKMKAEDATKAAEIEKMHKKEDMKMIEKLRQLEILEQNMRPCLDKEGVQKYEAETKLIKEQRAKREQLDQELADVWSKYHDRIRCKEDNVLNQIHTEKHNNESFKDAYEMVRRIQDEEEKKYNDFIEKGVNECKKRLQKREKEEEKKKEFQHQLNVAQALTNKANGDKQSADRAGCNKCVCDRQSTLRRPKRDKKACNPPTPTERPPYSGSEPRAARRREQAAGWSGAAAAHARFARAAGAALAECRHKLPVRRVVDEYRKFNGVKDLSIPNN